MGERNNTTMPVLVANLPQDILRHIMSLVRSGAFESPEQFLEVAARNQLVYELRDQANLATTDMAVSVEESQTSSRTNANGNALRDSAVTDATARLTPKRPQQDWATKLRLPDQSVPGPAPASAVCLEREQRIWGQVNRLLPIKLATRCLLAWSRGKDEWPQLTHVLKPIADIAATLGSHLDDFDTRTERKRDELLATGLPRTGNDASWDRFVTQFVARKTRDGNIYAGAVCQYPLAAIEDGRLALTDLGIEFAEIRNPIIDGGPFDSTLTDEERVFFIGRVVPRVPSELEDFKTTIAAVKAGKASPGELTTALASAVRSNDSAKNWTEVMMRTHVSGIVSRMVDLGLLRRHWEGRRVGYEVAPLGATVPDNAFSRP